MTRPLRGLGEIALARGDLETARTHAERAVSIGESSEIRPDDLVATRFLLARVLWPTRPSGPAPTPSPGRSEQCIEAGDICNDELAEIDAWLAEHRASDSPGE